MKKNNLQKLPKYKTSDNAHLYPVRGEKITGVSMTIQDQTLSLRDIVEKFTREYPVHLQKTGYFDYEDSQNEDFDNVDITRNPDFDYVDAIELKEEIKGKYKNQKDQNMITFPKKNTSEEKSLETQNNPSEVKEK